MDSREIDLDVVRVGPKDHLCIIEDDNNSLGNLQQEQSRHHWKSTYLSIFSSSMLLTSPSYARGAPQCFLGNILGSY